MPFIENDEQVNAFVREIGEDAIADVPSDIPFKDVMRAAFRIDNEIGSMIAEQDDMPDGEKVTDYDPWNDLTEQEKLDERFVRQSIYLDNKRELETLRLQRDRENQDRQLLAEAGWEGVAASVLSGLASPINFIPIGGAAYGTYKSGGSILEGALATGTAAAAGVGAQEIMLQQTQVQRTYGESIINMTAATFLGGVLGAAPPAIRQALTKEQLDEVEDSMNPEAKVAAGENSAWSDKSLSAAAVDADPKVRGKLAEMLLKVLPIDPLSRTITSDISATRNVATRLVENPVDMDVNTGTAVESRIKIKDGLYYAAADNHDKIYKLYKKEGGTLKRRDFDQAVGRAMRNGSEDEYIQRAADGWRKELYEPLKKEMIDNGLLPEDVTTETAENYLNRIYNTEKIAAERPKFKAVVKNWLFDQNETKMTMQSRIKEDADVYENAVTRTEQVSGRLETANKQLRDAQTKLEEAKRGGNKSRQTTLSKSISSTEEKIRALEKELDEAKVTAKEMGEQLERYVAEFPSVKAKGVKDALKARELRSATKMTKELKNAISRIVKAGYEDADIDRIADEITDRIISTPDGRLPYDYKIGDRGMGDQVRNDLSGPLQKRSFVIDDELIEDFLENDITTLGQIYLRKTAPDIELYKAFDGDVNMKAEMKKIRDEATAKSNAAKTDKERTKIEKQAERDIRDIAGMRDRIRGIYGNQTDFNNIFVRTGRVMRDLNYMRLMGGVVAASIPDLGRTIASEGFARSFGTLYKATIGGTKAFKVSAAEGKRYGIATDALMQGRAEIIADVADYTRGGNAFERGVRAAAHKFSSINLMNQWTSAMKQIHAVAMQTRVIGDLMNGKYPRELERLGISKDNADAMVEQMRKYSKKEDGIWIANAKMWDNRELEQMWGSALRKESDRVIIVPGQEKPLFMSGEMGKTILQFRSFMTSATHRILVAGLQRQDAYLMQGAVGMITLGMMSYVFKEWDAGREPKTDDLGVMVVEGIDRSGMLGILMEANNTVEKISGNNYGIRGVFNLSEPASRYASRSVTDSVAGPSFGLIGDAVKIMNATTDQGEWTDADTRAIRRLLPGQNLSILRQGFDKIEESIGD